MKADLMDLSLFRQWLKEKTSLAESTVYTYTKSVERFLTTNPDVDNIDDYNDFLIDTTIKKRAGHYYYALKKFIDYKIDNGYLKRKIKDKLVEPRQRHDIKRKRTYLSEDELFEVINYLDEKKHRIISLIQALTGVRVGDIFPLRRDNEDIKPEIYKDEPVLRISIVGKGKKLNVVYIHDKIAQEIIMNYITNNFGYDEYYFLELSDAKGRPGDVDNEFKLIKMNYQWYWLDLKKALKTAGVSAKKFATHDFRRCFARRAWEKYKDVHVLQKLLNHANPSTTLKYLEQSGLQNIDYHKEMQS